MRADVGIDEQGNIFVGTVALDRPRTTEGGRPYVSAGPITHNNVGIRPYMERAIFRAMRRGGVSPPAPLDTHAKIPSTRVNPPRNLSFPPWKNS